MARPSMFTRMAAVALLAVAAIPALTMLTRVLGGTHLQYADYWRMNDRLLGDGGSPQWLQLFTFNNEHPVVTAQAIYLINGRVFGGSNISQGIVVILIGLAEVGLLWALARRAVPTSPLFAATVVAVSSAMVFAPRGSWSFMKSMSGAAWLPANLFMLLALLLLSSGRRWPAVGSAVLATISYGTGFASWPAYAVTSMLQRRSWRPPPEAVIGLLVSVVWLRTRASVSTDTVTDNPLRLVDQARLLTRHLGFVMPGSDAVWTWVGGILLLTCLLAAVAAIVRIPEAAAPFVGVAVYGLATLVLISRGRSVSLVFTGLADRYHSLAALVWASTFALLVLVARSFVPQTKSWTSNAMAGVAAVVLLLAAMQGGQDAVRSLEDGISRQNRIEIATKFHLADGAAGLFGFGLLFPEGLSDRLEAIDHYPFGSDSWDCGWAGEVIDDTSGPSAGTHQRFAAEPDLDSASASRAVVADGVDAECVLATDAEGRVVGAGYPSDTDDGVWRILASSGATGVYAVIEGQPVELTPAS